jgi:HAD superfamily hydrolase (TIGR01509 family)
MPWHTRAWTAVLAEHGVTVDPHEFLLRTAGMTADVIFREWLGGALAESDIERLSKEKEALYRELFAPHVQLLPGASDFLEWARRREIGLALATAAPSDNVRFILEHTNLGDLLDTVVTADEGLPGKPAPDIFLTAARRLHVSPAEAVVFEDAILGIEAARRAGMRVVVLSTSLAPSEIPLGPDILAIAEDYTGLDRNILGP